MKPFPWKENRNMVNTLEELIEVTKDIDLKSMGVSLGKESGKIESASCFKRGDKWVFQEVDDRQHVYEYTGTEAYVAKKMYMYIKLRGGKLP